jgi:hypothetical protein
LSFALVQKRPTRRSSPIIFFFLSTKAAHLALWRYAFTIIRGIAITGLDGNSSAYTFIMMEKSLYVNQNSFLDDILSIIEPFKKINKEK